MRRKLEKINFLFSLVSTQYCLLCGLCGSVVRTCLKVRLFGGFDRRRHRSFAPFQQGIRTVGVDLVAFQFGPFH